MTARHFFSVGIALALSHVALTGCGREIETCWGGHWDATQGQAVDCASGGTGGAAAPTGGTRAAGGTLSSGARGGTGGIPSKAFGGMPSTSSGGQLGTGASAGVGGVIAAAGKASNAGATGGGGKASSAGASGGGGKASASGGLGGATAVGGKAGASGGGGVSGAGGKGGASGGGVGGTAGTAGKAGGGGAGSGGTGGGGTGGTLDEGGAAGSGGDGGDGGARPQTLAEACSSICNFAAGLTGCATTHEQCALNCVGYEEPAPGLQNEYVQMMRCASENLATASQYFCAEGGAINLWSPVAGTPCESALCSWTCHDANVGDVNVYDRCACP